MGERIPAGYEPPKHKLDDAWHVPIRILSFSSSDAEALCPTVYAKGEPSISLWSRMNMVMTYTQSWP
jgi:hypothetical protein